MVLRQLAIVLPAARLFPNKHFKEESVKREILRGRHNVVMCIVKSLALTTLVCRSVIAQTKELSENIKRVIDAGKAYKLHHYNPPQQQLTNNLLNVT